MLTAGQVATLRLVPFWAVFEKIFAAIISSRRQKVRILKAGTARQLFAGEIFTNFAIGRHFVHFLLVRLFTSAEAPTSGPL